MEATGWLPSIQNSVSIVSCMLKGHWKPSSIVLTPPVFSYTVHCCRLSTLYSIGWFLIISNPFALFCVCLKVNKEESVVWRVLEWGGLSEHGQQAIARVSPELPCEPKAPSSPCEPPNSSMWSNVTVERCDTGRFQLFQPTSTLFEAHWTRNDSVLPSELTALVQLTFTSKIRASEESALSDFGPEAGLSVSETQQSVEFVLMLQSY